MPIDPEGVMGIIMADEAYLRKVIELQGEFAKRLETRDIQPRHLAPSLLARLLECDDDIVEISLGHVGCRLKGFAQEVDFGHPELASIFDGALADDQNFSQECLELLSLAQFAKDRNFSRIIPMLGKIVTKESLGKGVVRRLDSPTSTRMHVRLLKNPEDREEIRSTKKMQVIDLGSVYKKGEDAWRAQPDNFSRFLRFDTAYQDEIVKAERRAKRYTDMGCSSLAEEILKSVEAFKEHMNHSYYGFNRITMTNAAVILAKSLGYSYNPPTNSFFPKDDTTGKIVAPRKFFGSYNFDPDFSPIEYSSLVSQAAGTPVFCPRHALPFVYEPRVYPLSQFWKFASEAVVKTVQTLESFPDADGKPIFDHFGVIVPGVSFPSPAKADSYSFIDDKGLCRTFVLRDNAVKELDAILVRDRHFYPIVIGERDGKCYFISFFN